MKINFDVPIKMDDGLVLRADVYRPIAESKYPVLLTYGPYGKGLSFQEGYPQQWERLVKEHPDVLQGSTNKYQSWEVPDPERWVPHGYVCVRVDSRGAGRSPGYILPYSKREANDICQCIEWAAAQPWSNGKVAMLGISYFAINQWQVAAMQPPHLAAIVPWEGANDPYRDMARHGGILSVFRSNWIKKQVVTVQHGLGTRGRRNPNTGELVAGPETLSDEELAKNRSNPGDDYIAHPLDDEYYAERRPNLSKIKIPILTCANWGGQGLHLRGNVQGFLEAGSDKKWLEIHGREHWTEFYTTYGLGLQRKFLDHFLKGENNGWEKQPRVLLNVRSPTGFKIRGENEWPLARTKWTPFYLNTKDKSLSSEPVEQEGVIEYETMKSEGITFYSAPLEEETEITGPSSVKLYISSSTRDADIFAVFRVFEPSGEELVFQGALDSHTPIGQGWLRASHRRVDKAKSKPYAPFHTHNVFEPLYPGEIYELDVEIWPTCIVIPPKYRFALTIRGKDYEYSGKTETISTFVNEFKGCGPFIHTEPRDRPPELFDGQVKIYSGGMKNSHILLPFIP